MQCCGSEMDLPLDLLLQHVWIEDQIKFQGVFAPVGA